MKKNIMKRNLVLLVCALLIYSVIHSAMAKFQTVAEDIKTNPKIVAMFERRVELKKQKAKHFKALYDVATLPVSEYNAAQIEVVNAEIALYRYSGERKKLLTALQEKLDLTQKQCMTVEIGHGQGTIAIDHLCDAQVALIDAELELELEKESQTHHTTKTKK
ncbi:MAG: hypothetical protein LBJ00_17535 [Planctomycetaceae bacterium]|nr:hypothetical protein [Planctomycetaceae bacterium]